MKRFSVFDRYDAPLFDLSDEVTGALRSEEINKEHKLDITTTQPLSEGMRILFRDGMLEWHEFVIDDPDSHHDGASVVEGTYGCTWSMQYDLAGKDGGVLWASAEPGTLDPITARRALEIALSPQSRWEVGNVTLQSMGGASLHDGQVWDYLAKLVSVFGGEIEPRIEVDPDGTIHRYVDWSARIGSEDAVRRFDYGEDCTFIRRKEAPGPRYCGIRPRGGSEKTDDDGVDYSDRCGVEEEPEYDRDGIWHPANSPYVYDRAAMDDFKRPDGQGGWEYPCLTVIYDLETDGDQEELLNKAIPDVRGYVYPDTTYEANVLQFVKAGMEAHGVRLGDTVHIVDKRFGDSPLRLEARVTKMETNELDDSDVTLTIGSFGKVEDAMRGIVKSEVGTLDERLALIENGKNGSLVYLKTLLDAINSELNVTGGYYYLVPGRGIYTYDRAVSDPTVGTEATAVTQIVGGGIRIANSRTAQGDWDWKSVFVSGHVLAELVTAVQITAGYIGNPSGDFYINFDTHEYRLGAMAQIGGRSVQDVLDTVDATITAVDVQYAQNQSNTVAPVTGWTTTAPTWQEGYYIWQRTVKTTNSGTTYSQPTCISGREGADGVGITSIEEQYYLSTSNTTQTGGSWSSTQPTWESGKYIWMRSKVTWDNGSITFTTPTLGNAVNALGERVQAISIKNMSPFFENEPTVGEYWTRIEKYWSGSGTGSFAITKLEDGWAHVAIRATAGYLQQGVILCVATDASDVVDGTLLVEIKNRVTTSTQGTDFSIYSDGQLRSKSWSGSTYTVSFDGDTELRLDMTPSGTSNPVAWMHFAFLHKSGSSPASSDLALEFDVRMSYYAQLGYEGGYIPYSTAGLSVSEVQSIASDVAASAVASQTQADIFNKLTNNGELQGLYMSDGNLYVNASFIMAGALNANRISGGTLKLGGSGNGNGVLEVYDANDSKIGEWNNAGATISGQVRLQKDAPSLGSGWVVSTEMGSFSDTIETYYGTKSGTQHGLKIASEHPSSSNSNQVMIIPGKKGTAYEYDKSAYLVSRTKMILASDTSSGDGAYLGLIQGETALSNGAGYRPFSRVYLADSSISFYLWNGSSGFNALKLNYSGTNVVVQGSFYVSGTKSRVVDTADYSDRLLYCYETPAPLFGDVGSGTIGEDGTCIVSIDDVFSECARTDVAYQVFLQKCGPGDLWVSEKSPSYFLVEGTPNLNFDWELKAHQTGYEATRLEDAALDESINGEPASYTSPLESYSDELSYVQRIESLYEEDQ